METYETDVLSQKEKDQMIKWFNEEIGTNYEVNNDWHDGYYIVFFDLTMNEISKIRSWEIALHKKRETKSVEEWEVFLFS